MKLASLTFLLSAVLVLVLNTPRSVDAFTASESVLQPRNGPRMRISEQAFSGDGGKMYTFPAVACVEPKGNCLTVYEHADKLWYALTDHNFVPLVPETWTTYTQGLVGGRYGPYVKAFGGDQPNFLVMYGTIGYGNHPIRFFLVNSTTGVKTGLTATTGYTYHNTYDGAMCLTSNNQMYVGIMGNGYRVYNPDGTVAKGAGFGVRTDVYGACHPTNGEFVHARPTIIRLMDATTLAAKKSTTEIPNVCGFTVTTKGNYVALFYNESQGGSGGMRKRTFWVAGFDEALNMNVQPVKIKTCWDCWHKIRRGVTNIQGGLAGGHLAVTLTTGDRWGSISAKGHSETVNWEMFILDPNSLEPIGESSFYDLSFATQWHQVDGFHAYVPFARDESINSYRRNWGIQTLLFNTSRPRVRAPDKIVEDFDVTTKFNGLARNNRIAFGANRQLIVVYQKDGGADGDGSGVYCTIFDSFDNITSFSASVSEFQVNSVTAGDQTEPQIAVLDSGNKFVVVWVGVDSNVTGIFGKIYNLDGSVAVTDFAVNTNTAGDQKEPSISRLGIWDATNFVVTWTTWDIDDALSWGIAFQRFDGTGAKVGSEGIVNDYVVDEQHTSTSTTLANGNVAICFIHDVPIAVGGTEIYTRVLQLDGTFIGNAVQVNKAVHRGDEQHSNIAGFSDGRYLVSFDSNAANFAGRELFHQFRHHDGSQAQGSTYAHETIFGSQTNGDISQVGPNRYVATWTQSSAQNGSQVFLRTYDIDGAPNGCSSDVSTLFHGAESNSHVLGLPKSGGEDRDIFVVVWDQYSSADLTQGHISMALYNIPVETVGRGVETPVKQGAEVRANIYTTKGQTAPSSAASVVSQTLLTVWSSYYQDEAASWGIYGRMVNWESREPIGSEFRLNTATTGQQEAPSVTALRNGNYFVTWQTDETGDLDCRFNIVKGTDGTLLFANDIVVHATTTGSQFQCNAILLATGNVAVIYRRSATKNGHRLFDPSGAPITGDILAPQTLQRPYDVTVACKHHFTTFWYDGANTMKRQTFDNNGVYKSWGTLFARKEAALDHYTSYSKNEVKANRGVGATCTDSDKILFSWDYGSVYKGYDTDFSGQALAAMWFSAVDFAPLGNMQIAASNQTHDQQMPVVQALPSGHVVLTWWSRDHQFAFDVRGQVFDCNGVRVGQEFEINSYTLTVQARPSIAAIDTHNFAVTFDSYAQIDGGVTLQQEDVFISWFQIPGSTLLLPPGNTLSGANCRFPDKDVFIINPLDNTFDGCVFKTLTVNGIAGKENPFFNMHNCNITNSFTINYEDMKGGHLTATNLYIRNGDIVLRNPNNGVLAFYDVVQGFARGIVVKKGMSRMLLNVNRISFAGMIIHDAPFQLVNNSIYINDAVATSRTATLISFQYVTILDTTFHFNVVSVELFSQFTTGTLLHVYHTKLLSSHFIWKNSPIDVSGKLGAFLVSNDKSTIANTCSFTFDTCSIALKSLLGKVHAFHAIAPATLNNTLLHFKNSNALIHSHSASARFVYLPIAATGLHVLFEDNTLNITSTSPNLAYHLACVVDARGSLLTESSFTIKSATLFLDSHGPAGVFNGTSATVKDVLLKISSSTVITANETKPVRAPLIGAHGGSATNLSVEITSSAIHLHASDFVSIFDSSSLQLETSTLTFEDVTSTLVSTAGVSSFVSMRTVTSASVDLTVNGTSSTISVDGHTQASLIAMEDSTLTSNAMRFQSNTLTLTSTAGSATLLPTKGGTLIQGTSLFSFSSCTTTATSAIHATGLWLVGNFIEYSKVEFQQGTLTLTSTSGIAATCNHYSGTLFTSDFLMNLTTVTLTSTSGSAQLWKSSPSCYNEAGQIQFLQVTSTITAPVASVLYLGGVLTSPKFITVYRNEPTLFIIDKSSFSATTTGATHCHNVVFDGAKLLSSSGVQLKHSSLECQGDFATNIFLKSGSSLGLGLLAIQNSNLTATGGNNGNATNVYATDSFYTSSLGVFADTSSNLISTCPSCAARNIYIRSSPFATTSQVHVRSSSSVFYASGVDTVSNVEVDVPSCVHCNFLFTAGSNVTATGTTTTSGSSTNLLLNAPSEKLVLRADVSTTELISTMANGNAHNFFHAQAATAATIDFMEGSSSVLATGSGAIATNAYLASSTATHLEFAKYTLSSESAEGASTNLNVAGSFATSMLRSRTSSSWSSAGATSGNIDIATLDQSLVDIVQNSALATTGAGKANIQVTTEMAHSIVHIFYSTLTSTGSAGATRNLKFTNANAAGNSTVAVHHSSLMTNAATASCVELNTFTAPAFTFFILNSNVIAQGTATAKTLFFTDSKFSANSQISFNTSTIVSELQGSAGTSSIVLSIEGGELSDTHINVGADANLTAATTTATPSAPAIGIQFLGNVFKPSTVTTFAMEGNGASIAAKGSDSQAIVFDGATIHADALDVVIRASAALSASTNLVRFTGAGTATGVHLLFVEGAQLSLASSTGAKLHMVAVDGSCTFTSGTVHYLSSTFSLDTSGPSSLFAVAGTATVDQGTIILEHVTLNLAQLHASTYVNVAGGALQNSNIDLRSLNLAKSPALLSTSASGALCTATNFNVSFSTLKLHSTVSTLLTTNGAAAGLTTVGIEFAHSRLHGFSGASDVALTSTNVAFTLYCSLWNNEMFSRDRLSSTVAVDAISKKIRNLWAPHQRCTTLSETIALTLTLSQGLTATPTKTRSIPPTKTTSSSRSKTASPSPSLPDTETISLPITATEPLTKTPSVPITRTETITKSISESKSSLPMGCATQRTLVACQADWAECYWSTMFGACINTTVQHTIGDGNTELIDGAVFPFVMKANESIQFVLYGPPAVRDVSVYLKDVSGECPPSGNIAWRTSARVGWGAPQRTGTHERINYVFEVKDTDTEALAAFREVCVRFNSTGAVVLVPNSRFAIGEAVRSELTSCSTTTTKLFEKTPFRLRFSGNNLRVQDKFAIIKTHSDLTCDSFGVKYYSVAGMVDVADTFSFFTLEDVGNYTVCYLGPHGDDHQQCSHYLFAEGLPPWQDPDDLRLAANKIPPYVPSTRQGQQMVEVNNAVCSSLVVIDQMMPQDMSSPPLLHPVTGKVQFGSLQTPFLPDETCAVLVKPLIMSQEELSQMVDDAPNISSTNVLALRYDMRFMDSTDVITVFEPSASAFTGAPRSSEVDLALAAFPEECPRSINGYTLSFIVNNSKKEGQVRVPLDGGAMVFFCSDDRLQGGVSATLRYTLEKTLCPNDCKDSTGVSRGTCNAFLRACDCDLDWGGEDCGTYQGCSGVGPKAIDLLGRSGSLTFRHRSQPASGCGYQLAVDPSDLQFQGKYAVGLQLRKGVLSSLDCTSAYISVHSGDYTQPEIHRYCRNDVLSGDPLPPVLLRDTHSVYVAFYGSATFDMIDMQYTAVSLECPGNVSATGRVEPEDICSRLGTCVEVEYSVSSTLLSTSKQCRCKYPVSASASDATCDTCAFGFDPISFPKCRPLNLCPDNCSSTPTQTIGVCTDEGCLCGEGYFGRGCEDKVVAIEAAQFIASRIPFDNATAGDMQSAGQVDKTKLSCEFVPSRCLRVERPRGKAVERQPSKISDSFSFSSDSFTSRRLAERAAAAHSFHSLQSNNTNATASNLTAYNASSGTDYGLLINKVTVRGSIGDYVRKVAISGSSFDVTGEFTVAAWLQITQETNGWLAVKSDTTFYANGKSPVIDRATYDVVDRFKPFGQLKSIDNNLVVYFGIYINGRANRLDVMITDPSRRNDVFSENSTTTPISSNTEEWMAVRHFRLGEHASVLFDGTWRYLVVAFFERNGRYEGQVYVDGHTDYSSPDYSQCFPFPVPAVRPIVNNASTLDDSLVVIDDEGGSLCFGYGATLAMDELRVYGTHISHTTIVNIGGKIFLDAVLVDRAALIGMAVISFITLGVVLFLFIGHQTVKLKRRKGWRKRLTNLKRTKTMRKQEQRRKSAALPPGPAQLEEEAANGEVEVELRVEDILLGDDEDELDMLQDSDDEFVNALFEIEAEMVANGEFNPLVEEKDDTAVASPPNYNLSRRGSNVVTFHKDKEQFTVLDRSQEAPEKNKEAPQLLRDKHEAESGESQEHIKTPREQNAECNSAPVVIGEQEEEDVEVSNLSSPNFATATHRTEQEELSSEAPPPPKEEASSPPVEVPIFLGYHSADVQAEVELFTTEVIPAVQRLIDSNRYNCKLSVVDPHSEENPSVASNDQKKRLAHFIKETKKNKTCFVAIVGGQYGSAPLFLDIAEEIGEEDHDHYEWVSFAESGFSYLDLELRQALFSSKVDNEPRPMLLFCRNNSATIESATTTSQKELVAVRADETEKVQKMVANVAKAPHVTTATYTAEFTSVTNDTPSTSTFRKLAVRQLFQFIRDRVDGGDIPVLPEEQLFAGIASAPQTPWLEQRKSVKSMNEISIHLSQSLGWSVKSTEAAGALANEDGQVDESPFTKTVQEIAGVETEIAVNHVSSDNIQVPHHLNPLTWVIFLDTGFTCEKPMVKFSKWLRRRFNAELKKTLDDTGKTSEKRKQRYREDTMAEALLDVVEAWAETALHLPNYAWRTQIDVIESALFELERARICKTDEEFETFSEAYEAVKTSHDPDINMSGMRIYHALEISAIEPPADQVANRRVIIKLDELHMHNNKNQKKKDAAKQARKCLLVVGGNIIAANRMVNMNNDLGAAPKVDSEQDQDGRQHSENDERPLHSKVMRCFTKFHLPEDFMLPLRLAVIRDCWQVMALLMTGLTFPNPFISVWGKIASIFALSFSVAFSVHFEVGFFLCAIVSMVGFILFVGTVISERSLTVKSVENRLRRLLQLQEEALAAGKKISIKTGREKVTMISVAILTSLYLPVTQNVVIVIGCHKSIQCLYDCYNEPRHNILFGFSVILGLCISFLTPILLFRITYKKKKEFKELIGEVADPLLEAKLWGQYTRVDPSPYTSVYAGFTSTFAQFQCIVLVVKALMCVLTLGVQPDSTPQIVVVTLVQTIFTGKVGGTNPFRIEVCNFLMLLCQFFVVLSLAMNCLYRTDPEVYVGPYGGALNIIGGITLVGQLIGLVAKRIRC